MGATLGVILEIIATLVDEVVVGMLFADDIFAAVNLITPYTLFETFIAYLASTAGAALIMRAQGARDQKKMSELFSQTVIVCGICGIVLTLLYVVFTPQLVRFVADDPSVYNYALDYFEIMRFYPLLDAFDTFMFAYVLYRGGYINFYIAIVCRIVINTSLSWLLGSKIGLKGVGLASIISLLAALSIKLVFLLNTKHGLKFKWYFNPREILEVAKLGLPESAISLFVVIMEFLLNNITLTGFGAAGVAAVSVVINIFEFTFYLSEGISEYEIVSVNDSIGKNSAKSMDHAIKQTLRAALIEGVVLFGIIFLASGVLPEAFDIDNAKTASQAATMLVIFSPAAIFICLKRVTAMIYQYTRRLPRTFILLGMATALLPALFGMLFGKISLIGIGVGIALGPIAAILLMYVYVHFIKKEKMFDYSIMHLN